MASSDSLKSERSPGDYGIPVALTLTAVSIILHLTFVFSAGGLWRDEAGGVALATLPTLSDTWHELTHDSFPPLHVFLLRLWVGMGLGSDLGLRCLGGLIGLSWLGAVWWNARIFGLRAPLVSLSLLAGNLAMIRWGDSVRAYGLGCVLITLFVGRVWLFLRRPNAVSFGLASGLALLSVQCLYQCAFLVAASCIAGCIVCLRRSNSRGGLLTLLIGVLPALSLLPYLRPLRDAQKWWIVEKTGFNPGWSWYTLSEAMGTPPFVGPWLWLALLVGACGYGLTWFERRISRRDELSKDLPLFGALTAILGLVGYFVFVVNAGLPTQPWYWLLLLSFLAVCIESILGAWVTRRPIWTLPVLGLIALISVAFTATQIRKLLTNMPQVAVKISAEARAQDLILVYPWYLGVSFDRYYQTNTPWVTVPDIADHRFHRYDQLKERLQEADALRPLFERIDATLQQGGSIWLVGSLPGPEPDEKGIPTLPPAPDSPTGWYDEPYNHVWGRQLDFRLRQKARQIVPVLVPETKRATRYEAIPIFKVSPAL